ncbi:MAG: helix-turn-helix domain-containing protein [Halofilum sp. (in: g-proteobacteria)]
MHTSGTRKPPSAEAGYPPACLRAPDADNKPHAGTTPCSICRLSPGCLPAQLALPDHEKLRAIIRPLPALGRDQTLFEGRSPRDLFILRSGSLKTTVHQENGGQQILGFHLPGNVAGFGTGIEDFPGGRILAMERSSVCAINLDRLLETAQRIDGLQKQLYRLLEDASTLAQQHVLIMGRHDAEARVALFLHDWSRRLRMAGLNWYDLHLPMRRGEIAGFLGLATETTSRTISRLQADGIVNVTGRRGLRILDPVRLATLAEIDAQHA